MPGAQVENAQNCAFSLSFGLKPHRLLDFYFGANVSLWLDLTWRNAPYCLHGQFDVE
jgi:hypothetical protein